MDEPPIDNSRQSLVAHLLELRRRTLHSLAAIGLIFLCLCAFAGQIYEHLSAPLRATLPAGSGMIATDVISPFTAPLKVTFFVSVLFAMPYILHQAWAFIAPGLYRREKAFALPLFASSVVLFYAGVAFAYFIIIRLISGFIVQITPDSIALMTDINSYHSFALKLFFAFGLAFEIPIATVLLVKAGLASTRSLAAKRPYIIVGCFVLGMLLTPPDVFSQLFLATPMWALFELGLLFARLVERPTKAPESDA